MSFLDQLQPASFRGVPFGVHGANGRFGRRGVIHEYPKKNKPWVEDLGRGTRKIALTGYLVEDALTYDGGDVIAQRERLIAAVEQGESAPLVHPTLGRLTVSAIEDSLDINERVEDGWRYFEFTLELIESGDREFPTPVSDTPKAVQASADACDVKTIATYVTTAKIAIARGAAVIQKVESTVADWSGQVTGLVNDATGLLHMAVALPGNLGRYFGGRTSGFTGTILPPTSTDTLEGLTALGIANRATVAAELANVAEAATAGDPDALAAAAQTVFASLLSATPDPADAVRLLSIIAGFQTTAEIGASELSAAIDAAGAATAGMFRRQALAALARACANYQPASASDAARVRDAVRQLFDDEITVAGDAGDDDDYLSLRALSAAVLDDLNARGATLPPLKVFTVNGPLPALVLAQRLYRDPSRADELVTQVDPAHPGFFPTTFQALAN